MGAARGGGLGGQGSSGASPGAEGSLGHIWRWPLSRPWPGDLREGCQLIEIGLMVLRPSLPLSPAPGKNPRKQRNIPLGASLAKQAYCRRHQRGRGSAPQAQASNPTWQLLREVTQSLGASGVASRVLGGWVPLAPGVSGCSSGPGEWLPVPSRVSFERTARSRDPVCFVVLSLSLAEGHYSGHPMSVADD